ncbi:MAG: putative toxin-antitoxin system toxin component, PIN family [bacterium]|nr:putative toxin-antitoxin system toxin component, PIN family [bacterium]
MYRVVIDTNVMISGILWRKGYSRNVLLYWLKGAFQLVSSTEILNELIRVLRGEFEWDDIRAYRWYRLIGSLSDIVFSVKEYRGSRDLSDNKFLQCAVEGNAKYLVSKDKDLLSIESFHGVQIINVTEFVEILESLS